MSRSKNNSRKRARQKRLRAALLHLPFTSHLLTLGWWNWKTRTFEGRMPKGLRVRVPPRARFQTSSTFSERAANLMPKTCDQRPTPQHIHERIKHNLFYITAIRLFQLYSFS